VGGGLRYFGGAVAFGFAAMWIMWSLAAALICLLAAAVGYAAGLLAERAGGNLASPTGTPATSTPSALSLRRRTAEADELSRKADEINHDLGHLYEPPAGTPPRAPEAHGSSLQSSDRSSDKDDQ
jgi:hypothetical protein